MPLSPVGRRGVWPIAGVVVLIAAVVGAVIATDQPPTPQTAAGGASPSAQEDNEVAGDHDRAGHGAPATAPATPRPAEAARVEAALADMSLQQKVGQLLVAAVRGDHPTDVSDAAARQNSARFNAPTPAAVVERHRLGGVIYFTYADVDAPPDPGRSTIHTPVQTAELSRGLQSAAVDSTGVGLVIATDQEHGFITRTPDAWTRMPGSMALAATRDRGLAEASATAAARELRAVGINVTLAPVADVNTEPDNPVIGVRSPGGSPSLVADVVAGQVRGLAEGGVGATAKHFPGHGSVDVDSHAALPTVEGSAATLRDRDLAPFEAAIDAGVGAIMPGHLSVPAFDDQNPATVSRPLIDGLLRGELGFDGVVVTDALDMAAIAERGSSADVALRALRAGVDMLLMPPDLPAVRDSLLAAVDDGRLSRDRLDASVRRILTWKAELGLLDDPAALPAASPGEVVGAPEHGELARRVAQRAITAVDGACDTLPVGQSQQVVVIGPADGGADALAAALSRRGVAATAVATGLVPSASEIRQARQAAAGADVAVQVTTSAWRHQAQRRLNAAVAEAAPALVTVSTAEPYDAVDTDADVQLAAYDRGEAAMAATAGVLRGKPAHGRLPVPVGDHPLGAGGALAACGEP